MTQAGSIADLRARNPMDPIVLQCHFRTLLDVLSRPCAPLMLKDVTTTAEAVRAIAAVLVDHDVTVALDTADANLGDWIGFHCGARADADLDAADFVFLDSPGQALPLDRFRAGTDAYPDRSATLVIAVAGFSDSGVTVAGPGIQNTRGFGITGDGAEAFWDAWRAQADLFPRGIDIVFVCEGRVAGLPRSTRLSGGS